LDGHSRAGDARRLRLDGLREPHRRPGHPACIRRSGLSWPRLVDIADLQEVYDLDDIEEFDEHLADNFKAIEPGKRTIWGTIHMYRGEGEA